MIDKMMEQHKARRNQLQNEEMFEPIEIDFGYEDAVAFDSDKGKLFLKDSLVEREGNFLVWRSLCMRPSQIFLY